MGGRRLHLRISDVMFIDDVLDFLDQEDSHKSDDNNAEGDCDDSLSHREFVLVHIAFSVRIFAVIATENLFV
jgi:hypothetical protein